ncbi:extradiol ring-cleavage dioxygenase [Blastomonas sp. AAP53]|uniref:DODA-type extradiol aromatic ring-opening family dioxygenase n=1 Tax=Blastomonas sp. AAP53 TaxID=1248760 RepID=UPI00030BEE34|nr:extradiol ring-cleavage dioxygenase [Blastomonas sp. AAP53]
MAEIVLAIGTSHTPILTLPGSEWHNRAAADLRNPRLTLEDGTVLNYEELVARNGEPYGDVATVPMFNQIAYRCQQHLDRLAAEIERAAPDIVIVIGDDQSELYRPGNMPAIAIYWGQDVVTHSYDDEIPDWMKTVAKGYAMDETHVFPGHPDFALELIHGLMDRDVDLAVCNEVKDPQNAGFGHAFGFPVERLFGERSIPIIPVLLNTYYPPNVMSAARCHDVGEALRQVIEQSPSDYRVAVLASGGLSHFVVEEGLDRRLMDNLSGGRDILRSIPREALLEGSSEILNWIMTAGVASGLALQWSAYEPIRRTPAGTGIGVAFAYWSK